MCKGCNGCCGNCQKEVLTIKLNEVEVLNIIEQGLQEKFEEEFGVKDIRDSFEVTESQSIFYGLVYRRTNGDINRNLTPDMVTVIEED